MTNHKGGHRPSAGAPRQYVTLAELPSAISFGDIITFLPPSARLELADLPEYILEIIASRVDNKHIVDGVVNVLRERAEAARAASA